jgi:hypothetical protein
VVNMKPSEVVIAPCRLLGEHNGIGRRLVVNR